MKSFPCRVRAAIRCIQLTLHAALINICFAAICIRFVESVLNSTY